MSGTAGDDIDPILAARIVEVACFDLALAKLLVDEWSGSIERLEEVLGGYAVGHSDGDPVSVGVRIRSSREPPHPLVDLWSRGVADRWAELDPCLQSALAVVRTSRELKSRVWRGQVRTLLPQIELERQRLAEWALRHRRALSNYWARQDVIGLEIGPLCKLISETSALRSQRQQWELAQWLREARNRLAHWQVVGLEQLQYGRKLIDRAHEEDASII